MNYSSQMVIILFHPTISGGEAKDETREGTLEGTGR